MRATSPSCSKPGAAVPGVHDIIGEPVREDCDEVGSMHPEEGVPPLGVRGQDRSDRGAVVPEITRAGTDASSQLLDRGPHAQPLQLAHAIGSQEDAGTDLAQRRRLFVDRSADPPLKKRVGGKQATDPAPDDGDTQR
jgi:hypothetical protein